LPDLRDLTSYCGLYCPGCELHQGRSAKQLEKLRRTPEKYSSVAGTDSPAEDQTASSDDTVEGVLDSVSRQYGSCSGCKKGDGKKDCQVRSCASDRGYSTCVECIRMENCKALSRNPRALPSLREIRDKGYDSWLKTKEEMVGAGWTFTIDEH
jgi:hypothetical protein